jgi:hypothetical protein
MANMTTGKKWSRRTFVGTALVGAGVAAGALIRKAQNPGAPAKTQGANVEGEFAYDVSEFEKTDPKHLLHQPTGSFDTGFERVKRLTTAPGGLVLVAGDRSVKFLNSSGVLQSEIKLERPPHCLHVAGADELLVGLGNYFEVYDFSGKQKLRSPRLGEETFLTAIAAHDRTVYLADAGNREVLRCDRRTGEITGRFGRKDEPPGAPGFVVPSPYFDLAVGRDRLHITNPGRLRMESYTFDGRFESSWGEPGMAINRFCGCCNPVYFTLLPEGGFITSEKGLARVNIYNASGVFQGAVAGPETLVDDKQLAKRACADCRLGGGFDVARDEGGRVFALDPFRKTVRMFTPRTATGATA